jgi:molybdopterin molybdotransferase
MSKYSCDHPSLQNQPLIPVNEAIQRLLAHAKPVVATETVSLFDAYGRTLAESITATINVPPADNSAMDGYAVYSNDFATGNSTSLPISQFIYAGEIGVALQQKTVARIFTGASIPVGADAVIMQELCEISTDISDTRTETPTMTSSTTVQLGVNIRRAGEDITIGDTVLTKGQLLQPQDVALAASVGVATVTVYRKLRVGVFFTGDELCEPDQALQAGQIYNSNRYTLRGLLHNLGCEVIDFGMVNDTLDATREAMLTTAAKTDLVITSGGVSVGDADYVRIALEEIGQLNMWKINIKPGKPFAFGTINGTPFLGLPGNPVAVFTTFLIFARPFILHQQGNTQTEIKSVKVAADFAWSKKGYRTEYVRVQIINNAQEEPVLTLFSHQGSGVLTSTSWADGLAIIQAGQTITKGDYLTFLPFYSLL